MRDDAAAPSVPASVESADVAETAKPRASRVWLVYGALIAWMAGYVISLLVRGPNSNITWLDGWAVAGVDAVASIACLYRGVTRTVDRRPTLVLGSAMMSWAIGDALLTVESLGGKTPPVPSAADVFYILFYPLAYIAAVELLQKGLGRLARPNWLDGAVAGVGAAALCATFAFHSIVHLIGGTDLATTVSLTYPIGDLLLLSLVIGGTVLLTGRFSTSWALLGGGLSVIVLGDTFNLFQGSQLATRFGAEFNAAAWPSALILMSMSVWVAPRRADPLREERTTGMLLPGLASVAALAILVVATRQHVSEVAVDLAIATLVVAGSRFALSARSLRVMTEERHRQANTDELTGLGNRRQLTHVLETFFEGESDRSSPPRQLAFLFVDLNHFKEINDRFGHPAGDELLRQLGPRLTGVVGHLGSVVRLGGDELGVVLMDVDEDCATDVARRVVAEVEAPFRLHQINVKVGASIGVAMYPGNAVDASSLMWCADVAMYRAKLGGIPWVVFDQSLDGDENQIRLVEELASAVYEGGLELHYQPLLNLRTGEIRSVEALLRWPHPELGMIPPLTFLPLAEDSGLMGPLTEWVLHEAVSQCARWRDEGTEVCVSVNVSATNLLEDGFVEMVQDVLALHDMPASLLVIEITETTIIKNFELSQSVIERLRDFGIVVSIDDFGAGERPLTFLTSLALGELKLDRPFIADLTADESQRTLVRAAINFSHELGLRVVAEGIEDVATLELLDDMGCDLAQGYYISRPAPPDQLSFRSGREAVVGAD